MMALPVGEARKECASLGEKERVVLNIGGRRFETFRSTLLQHSGSLLETMFSDRNRDLLKPDKFGEYFFDRDSTCFEVILNYFRTGKLLLPSTINEDLFREECSFFQIEVEHEEEDPIAYTWGKGEHGQLGHGIARRCCDRGCGFFDDFQIATRSGGEARRSDSIGARKAVETVAQKENDSRRERPGNISEFLHAQQRSEEDINT